MRKRTVLLVGTLLMAGCATAGRFSGSGTFDASSAVLDDCDDKGGTFVNLFYDNQQIRTTAVAHVRAGEIFAIRLKPRNDRYNRPGLDYEKETVTISGKDSASAWLSASGSYESTASSDHELVICVPPTQPRGAYYYIIDITRTGSLDPRADVD